MPTYPCPHCGERTLSFRQKDSVGLLKSATCRRCGGEASVSQWPWALFNLCSFAIMVSLIYSIDNPTILLATMVAFFIFQWVLVPHFKPLIKGRGGAE